MAQQVINIGSAPNDGTGDQLRTAFDKCNDNFTELYAGSGGGGVPYTGATQNVDLGEYELKAGQFELDQSPTGTAGVGVIRWNDTDGTADLGLKGGNVTLQIGQEEVIRVVNKTGADLLESQYKVVRVRTQAEGGTQGQRLAVVLAQANTKANHTGVLGLVTEDIDNNQEGFITTFGYIRNINTTGSLQSETWNDGDTIWLSESVAGGLTNVEPTTHPVQMGYVVYAHSSNGKIFVRIGEGVDQLDELHDVNISSPTNNQVLAYTSATSLWENKSVSTALGFTPIAANSWVDYSSTSTIVGFATITTRELRYLIIGNVAIYYFNIQGTSNSSTFTFTIHTNHNGNIYFNGSGYTLNNTTSNNPSRMLISNASNVITLAPALTGGSWSASGGKGCSGIFLIQL